MKIHTLIVTGILMMSGNYVNAMDLNIKVDNIDAKRGGNLIVMIFKETGFPKIHEDAIFTQIKSIQNTIQDFVFSVDLEELSVKVLHDENGDGKVTKNWTGIYPSEGLGFTNGQKVSLTGPPKYKYSKVTKEQFRDGLTISVRYP